MLYVFRSVMLLIAATTLPALAGEATSSVLVAIPIGLTTSSRSTTPSHISAMEYVSVEGVRLANPSRVFAQSYERTNFHLIAGDVVYEPVVRPRLGAIDFHEPSLLGPGETTLVTVTFLVPTPTTTAKFEFVPHRLADDGRTVDWCCLYP